MLYGGRYRLRNNVGAVTDYTIRAIEPTATGRLRITYVVTATLSVRHLTITRQQAAHGNTDVLIRHAIEHVSAARKLKR